MRIFKDLFNRNIRLTDERFEHFITDHPELENQDSKIQETLLNPDHIVRSRTDAEVELFYKLYPSTPVTQKYLCIVAKPEGPDAFILTTYFTDTVKKGEILWQKK